MVNYKTGDYNISSIYQGGYSSMKAPSGWSNDNYIQAGSLSTTTDPRTAEIIKEVSGKLTSGLKNIEVTAILPEVFDSIPKQHFKEINRLAKLTGIDVSMHGILIEPSGVTQQGYADAERELAERKISDALIRSHDLNPDGNIPVTFHSSNGIPGSQLLPPSQRGKEGTDYKKLIAINRETGRPIPLESEIHYHPGDPELKPDVYTPEKRLRSINATEWDNSISQLIFNKERVDEILERYKPLIEHLEQDINSGKIKDGLIHPDQAKAIRHYRDADTYLRDLHQQVTSLFNKAYKYSDENQKAILKGFSEDFGKRIGSEGGKKNLFVESQAMHELLHKLETTAPKMYVPVEEFAVEKSSETFGNAAFKTYQKAKKEKWKGIPVTVIENPPAGSGLSTGKDIRDLVEASRKQFEKRVMEEGMSADQAKKESNKLIGATWDVGHINMLKAQGYEDKDIVAESEKVADVVKHVHLSDNFGMEHTELPMGMGNVPFREIMEKLGEKGFEAKKVIEAQHWWQHQKTSPFQPTLEGLDSPIYSMKQSPYWSQADGLSQGYFSGMDGAWLPQVNYETFGSGFSRLPTALGGSSPGAQGSRLSGRGLE